MLTVNEKGNFVGDTTETKDLETGKVTIAATKKKDQDSDEDEAPTRKNSTSTRNQLEDSNEAGTSKKHASKKRTRGSESDDNVLHEEGTSKTRSLSMPNSKKRDRGFESDDDMIPQKKLVKKPPPKTAPKVKVQYAEFKELRYVAIAPKGLLRDIMSPNFPTVMYGQVINCYNLTNTCMY
jgi:hypothetical protein